MHEDGVSVSQTLRQASTRGLTCFLRLHVGSNDLRCMAIALTIAAAEFVVCARGLLALTGLGVISTATALLWAVMILVPLSLTIGYLMVWARILGGHIGRIGRATTTAAPRELSQVA